MRDTERRAREGYERVFGMPPELIASAPGRINLIGEHTDYGDGYALPCAIDRRVAVAIGHGRGGLYSADFDDAESLDGCRGDTWAAYPRGIAWALGEKGHNVPAFQAAFAGDVPVAAGLSSSAAIESATILALDALCRLGMDRKQMALTCQRAENAFVGVNSGILDQYASLLSRAGHALLIDCRTLEARAIPLNLTGSGLKLLVCNTCVKRELGKTGYDDRRKSVERATRSLGLRALRDAGMDDLSRLSGTDQRRARHVVTENARVLAAAEALEREDFAAFGKLMYASHASLRDDYDVSTPELDCFVSLAEEFGALGARLTGAGFGGCAVALMDREGAGALPEQARVAFAGNGFESPDFYTFLPEVGAEVVR